MNFNTTTTIFQGFTIICQQTQITQHEKKVRFSSGPHPGDTAMRSPSTSGGSLAPTIRRPSTSGGSLAPTMRRPSTSGGSIRPTVTRGRPSTSGATKKKCSHTWECNVCNHKNSEIIMTCEYCGLGNKQKYFRPA